MFDFASRRTAAAGALGALLTLSALGCAGEGDGPQVRVRVPAGASFSQVVDSLAAKQVIERTGLFDALGRLIGAADEVKPGTYAFRRDDGWFKILEDLRQGRILTARLVIPEGWTLQLIVPDLARITGLSPDSVLAIVMNPAVAERLGVPGPTLEGYLYPATYIIPVDQALDTVLARLVDEYHGVWTPARRARADTLGMTERDVVTLASIVEKEAKRWDEMPLIAAVYHNRLEIGYPLQADPTVQYALGEHQQRLLYAHIDRVADDPYNTYRHPGLPPGPIASPSVRAIDAVLYPADADYLYFVARPDGTHVFTRSLQEHNRAKARIRQRRQQLPRTGGR